jgi:DNA mismatch repair ATPase MutS
MELEYILFIVAAIVALAGLSLNKKRKSARNLRRKIENSWGTKPSGKYKEEDMQAIAGYYENLHEAEDSRILLDDITWNDLDMDNVYKRLNSTFSTVGEEYLYALLREPVTDPGILKERGRLADFFRSNPEQRAKLQYIFASLGKKRFAGVSNHFFSKAEYNPFQRNKYILQLAIFLLSPFVMIVNLPVGVLLLISSFILNMTTYYKAKNLLSEHLDSMSYMVNLITYSMKTANCNIPGLERYSAVLRKSASKFKSTGFKSFYQIFYNTQDPFLEYIKIIFLVELISFESINKKISLYRTELRELFETVGLLDSMAAVASFQESVPFYTLPVMYRADAAHKPSLQFKDIYHPLIDEPVTNSVAIKKPVLITGSNASGKSTFLKTVAINAVLAQSISTCLASEYSSCYFLIYTSMALRDDLQGS